MSCRSCGEPVTAETLFCPRCGTSQRIDEGERRVVTVLFADLVGFTALSERLDPEEVKHLVDRAFDRLGRDITSFGGVIDKIMGDGIIALFGAPVAHEDDAERAVRSGLRMHQTLDELSAELDSPIRMRVGVNTGEVVVGTPSAGDYTAMGDVVNSAQRLQSMAEPGQTLVGGETRRATGETISYRSVGELPARGRQAPIEGWAALHAVHLPGHHDRRVARFVGRTHELDLLEAQGRLAVDGNRAQLVVVVGDTGIGKTRLVLESAARLADQSGAVVVEGRCLPYGEANVWWPVAELLRDLLTLPTDDTEPAMEAVVADHLGRFLDNAPYSEIERYTTAVLHACGHDTPLRGGDRHRNRSEVTLAFTNILEAALTRRPVVLVVSDLHWASPAVGSLLSQVLSELARRPLMVLVTTKSAEMGSLPQGRHGLSVIQLGPLSASTSADLLVELGLDPGHRHTAALVDRSGGNPFFLEELAGLLLAADQGASTPPATRGTGRPGDELDLDLEELPATLRGTIAARLDALQPGELALLGNAAVLGRTGPVAALSIVAAEVQGVSYEEFETQLVGLVEQDLLVVAGPRFRFHSDLVRDVAYGRLTKVARARQHQGIAEFLEANQTGPVRNSVVVAIADHYRSAAQLSLELPSMRELDHGSLVGKALYWLEQAGDRALDVGEPRVASRWYDTGVELALPASPELARFVYGRARARAEIHDLAGARADLERLSGLPDLDETLSAKAVLVRGDVYRKAGALPEAVSDLATAASLLERLDQADDQALALRLLGMTEMARSNDLAARQALIESRQVALAAGMRRSEGWALQTMAWHAFLLGRVGEARTLVEEAIEIFTEVEDNGALVWARGVLAWVAFHTGHWDEARALVDTILPETRRRGDPWAEAITLNLDSSLLLWSGAADAAKQRAREARTVAESIQEVTLSVGARAVEGRALVSLGRIEEGTQVLEEAFSAADQADDDEGRRMAVVTNIASAARLGEPERAIRWAARYDGEADDPSVVGETDLVVSLALALFQRGAVAEAQGQLHLGEAAGIGCYAHAVGALLAAASGDPDRTDHLVSLTLDGNPTYLDRIVALLARAAGRVQVGDVVGCAEALTLAWEVVKPTDDQLTRHLIMLAAAVFGQGDLNEAEDKALNVGLDPTGWKTAFTLAALPPNSPASSPAPIPLIDPTHIVP